MRISDWSSDVCSSDLLLEVISYNEAAGRFEFQLVHDYRAGATPRVSYARRELCAPFHQNLAPIFSRPLWAETNANPRIAARLAEHRDAFAGVPVDRGVDIPNAIDTATDHANMLGVWQKLWHDGCGKDEAAGRRCRGAAVLAALQYRLGGERGFDTDSAGWRGDFLPVVARHRKSAVEGKSVAASVDPGGRLSMKEKQTVPKEEER